MYICRADYTENTDRGFLSMDVMLTPALMIDGELKVSGRVADVSGIKELIGGK